jgi:hypothetical protein
VWLSIFDQMQVFGAIGEKMLVQNSALAVQEEASRTMGLALILKVFHTGYMLGEESPATTVRIHRSCTCGWRSPSLDFKLDRYQLWCAAPYEP